MILVDSNVLIDVMQNDAVWADWSAAQLQQARATQKLAINAVILAELSFCYDTLDELTNALGSIGAVNKPIPDAAAFAAGHAFAKYRRRKGVKTGVLPDFLIGAHALHAGYTLLTRDVARYKTYFPQARLIHP